MKEKERERGGSIFTFAINLGPENKQRLSLSLSLLSRIEMRNVFISVGEKDCEGEGIKMACNNSSLPPDVWQRF